MARSRTALLGAGLVLAILAGAAVRGRLFPTASDGPATQPFDPVWVDLMVAKLDAETVVGFDLWAAPLSSGGHPIHISKRYARALGPAAAITRALPFVSPPTSGRVAFGFYDGTKSELHVLDIASGKDTLVASEPVVFHAAAVDEAGTTYVLALDAASREEVGVFEVRQGSAMKKLIDPRDLPFRALRGSSLYLPPGGGTLITADCTFSDCTARLYSLETGAQIGARLLTGGVVSVGERAIAVQEFCSLPCAQELVELPNLESARIGPSCGSVALATYRAMPALISGSAGDCSAGGEQLIAQWPNRGRAAIGVPSLSGLALFQQSQWSVAALPDGWVLLTGDGTLSQSGRAALFDINSGRVVDSTISR